MDVDEERRKIARFIKCGLTVLVTILAIAAVVQAGKVIVATAGGSGLVKQKELPIYCVETEKPQVALSFDAAWGNEDTAKILEILKKHDVHVTFFMTGGWVSSYPDDVKAIAEAGHDLGNHSENHKQMSQLSAQECKEEIMKVHDKVKELTGKDMQLFRPPYGDYNDTLINVCRDNGYYPIQWDVDSLDWKNYGVQSVIDTVCNHKHLGNGSIILCHNGAKYTAEALDTLLTNLKEKGFQVVPISKIIYKDNYEINTEGRQHPTGTASAAPEAEKKTN